MDKQLPTPNIISFLLFPLIYFVSVKLCLAFAMTPEGTVIIWLPNAIVLATLLYYRGQRLWLFMLLMLAAEVAGDVPVFRWHEALMLGGANIAEVTLAYFLMRKINMSNALIKIEDVIKFIVAGPLVSSLFGALIGAAAIQYIGRDMSPYLYIVQVWWFGDALGLTIGTPLLLSLFYHHRKVIKPLQKVDVIVIFLSAGLLLMLLLAKNGLFYGVVITPTLLLPSMLYFSSRTDFKLTAIAVAILSFAVSILVYAGRNPFGDVSISLTILHAQEFIAILSMACMGFATLIARIRENERELEDRVAKRTDELQVLNQTLEQLSTTDGLTGIANRRRFDDVLEIEWARANRTQQPITLAILDIDWFKPFNDRYGHQAGDECLKKVSAVLTSNISRTGDLVARYGGEEFVLIAFGMDRQDAIEISKRLCKQIQALAIPHDQSVFGSVTVSIGVATMTPQTAQHADMLFKVADEALYEAKKQGRNQAVFKSPNV
jgi:diguanylate cyclase (GGDEF)-like protein